MNNGNGSYLAQVSFQTSVGMEEIIAKMIELGANGSPYDLLQNHRKYAEAVAYFLQHGARVDTLTATYGVSVRGTFDHEEDSFSLDRHSVNATTNTGPVLTKAFEGWAEVRKAPRQNNAPHLVACMDYATRKKNEIITPGEAAKLSGNRLQFEQADPNQGIFFVNAADNGVTRVSLLLESGPRRIQFKIPAELTDGSYYLQVHTKVDEHGNRLIGELPYLLTVGPLHPAPTATAADQDAES
jgi:hypothetical protein